MRDVLAMLAGGRKYIEMNFRTACEVRDVLLERLGLPEDVRHALQYAFERWNGAAFPPPPRARPDRRAVTCLSLGRDVKAV